MAYSQLFGAYAVHLIRRQSRSCKQTFVTAVFLGAEWGLNDVCICKYPNITQV